MSVEYVSHVTAAGIAQELRALQPRAYYYLTVETETDVLAGVPEIAQGTFALGSAVGWSEVSPNVLQYDGADTVRFSINGSISCSTDTANGLVHYYGYHRPSGGAPAFVPGFDIDRQISTAVDHGAMPLNGQVTMATGDQIEIWVSYSKSGKVELDHLTLDIIVAGA